MAMGKHQAIAGAQALNQRSTFLACALAPWSPLGFRLGFVAGATQAAL